MTTVAAERMDGKGRFDTVAAPFLQCEGLPFADIMDAESIERAFNAEDGLFAQDDIFSTDITLWAFLAQTLRDGKGAACSAAVADITTYMTQIGQKPPAGDTGDYCRARAKLSLSALRHLVVESAGQLEREADECWLWNGLHAKLVDGFTFTMPDTPNNQEAFPQLHTQRPGAGFPIARCCTVVSSATACVCDIAIGPYEGKETGESALLREIRFDVAVPGRQTEAITVITTLTDSDTYSAQDIATLYGLRWNVELDIRDIKQTLGLDHVRCKSPHMVRREVWVTLLAYNLIRKVIATSAVIHGKQPRRLSFTLTCQTVLASWILLSTGSARNAHQLWAAALGSIANHEVPLRPGRIEPRVLKRRRHRYPLMHAPRDELRAAIGKT
ncbi:MAG: transposase [Phycisphaerae bacterium]